MSSELWVSTNSWGLVHRCSPVAFAATHPCCSGSMWRWRVRIWDLFGVATYLSMYILFLLGMAGNNLFVIFVLIVFLSCCHQQIATWESSARRQEYPICRKVRGVPDRPRKEEVAILGTKTPKSSTFAFDDSKNRSWSFLSMGSWTSEKKKKNINFSIGFDHQLKYVSTKSWMNRSWPSPDGPRIPKMCRKPCNAWKPWSRLWRRKQEMIEVQMIRYERIPLRHDHKWHLVKHRN